MHIVARDHPGSHRINIFDLEDGLPYAVLIENGPSCLSFCECFLSATRASVHRMGYLNFGRAASSSSDMLWQGLASKSQELWIVRPRAVSQK